jgi:hypothetical protein
VAGLRKMRHRGLPKVGWQFTGVGGARSRAISIRISPNICRDTAISAIWNVT